MSISTATTNQQRQAQWQDRLAQQQESGLSIAAYCKREGISEQTFYGWRKRLSNGPSPTPFIDLGALPTASRSHATHQEQIAFDVRLDLPGGMVLTLTRR